MRVIAVVTRYAKTPKCVVCRGVTSRRVISLQMNLPSIFGGTRYREISSSYVRIFGCCESAASSSSSKLRDIDAMASIGVCRYNIFSSLISD